MTENASPSPNALKPEDWAGEMGARWLANLDRFEGMLAPIGQALLDRADFVPGQRVLDIGSGGGTTTLAIANAVAPDGIALGIDISPDLVGAAMRRAEAAGMRNASFLRADASTVTFDTPPFDRLFSRFGSMFFEQPVAAFSHLRSLLKGGAGVDLAVWGPPRENAWMMEMMGVLRANVEVAQAVPRAPGPFAFEDLDYLNEVLLGAGFTGIEIDAYEGLQPIGGAGVPVDEAVQFVTAAMAFGRALEDQDAAVRERATDDLTKLFEQHFVPGEGVLMACKAWLVKASG